MGGLGSQSRRKGELRAVEMSAAEQEAEAAPWRKPPEDQCETESYTCALADQSQAQVQLKVRIVRDVVTMHLVEFALVLQVWHEERWHSVAEIDTSHADECHIHQIGRTLDDRIGEPTHMMAVLSMEDVQGAYDLAYRHVESRWGEHVERWRNG